MIERIVSGFRTSLGLWKIVVAIYIFQFLLAATVGLQMNQVIDASIGNSLSIKELEKGYDYTVISDFITNHGGSFTPLLGQMRWMTLIYLVFASFISAGLLFVLTKKSDDYLDFFKGGARYFGRFLVLDVLFALVIALIVGVAFSFIGYLFGIAPTTFDTELPFLRLAGITILLAVLFTTFLIVWKVFIKIHHIESEELVLRSVVHGFKSFWRHKWKAVFYSLVFLLVSLVLIYSNHKVGSLPILIMIFVQQVFVLFKIFWRIMYYDVILNFRSSSN